ncbi:hypothetical protein QM996_23640 (plasmid) [Sinorhizobium chiapasense]|uniref:hypothetical protein n=1 Tax=Sinorhizobium chiapasense TaxID=501572 RepID=UPI002FE37430
MKRKTPVKPYVLFSVFRSNTFYIKFYSNSILVYSFDADTTRLRRCTKITIDGGMSQQLPIATACFERAPIWVPLRQACTANQRKKSGVLEHDFGARYRVAVRPCGGWLRADDQKY